MNSKLQKVATLIKKTFRTQEQNDCFDGCVLYLEEHCTIVSAVYMKGVEDKFTTINGKLDNISRKIDDIVGNGHGDGKS